MIVVNPILNPTSSPSKSFEQTIHVVCLKLMLLPLVLVVVLVVLRGSGTLPSYPTQYLNVLCLLVSHYCLEHIKFGIKK